MNEEDFRLAEKWNGTGYIAFGRILFKLIPSPFLTHFVRLSDSAWVDAERLRRHRAEVGMHELTKTDGGRNDGPEA